MIPKICAIGEPMIELAPVEGGLYRQGFAGDTFNTAWHMAQVLGPRARVGMVTKLGQDGLSNAFATEMQADGLDLSGVFRDPLRRMGLYLIELDGVERSFHYWRETSAARHLADDPVALERALAGADLIHLSGITLAILPPPARKTLFAVLAHARAKGAKLSFDPNIRPRLWPSTTVLQETLTAILPLVDIALPSFDDEETHFGDATPQATLSRFHAAGVTEVVVKNGAGPVAFAGGWVPTPAVSDIRDTTGAGDGFNAGYLAARLLGQGVEQAIHAGQTLAAAVLRQPGARASKAALATLGTFGA